MAEVQVFNGDLESALDCFKRRVEEEGTLGEYRRRQAFSSPTAERRKEKHFAELRQKSRERRRQLRRAGKDV